MTLLRSISAPVETCMSTLENVLSKRDSSIESIEESKMLFQMLKVDRNSQKFKMVINRSNIYEPVRNYNPRKVYFREGKTVP